MVLCGILGLLIIFANLIVIIVIVRNPQFPTNQMIYKLSLAFADILIGIFGVPSFLVNLYILNIGPYQKHVMKSDITFTNNHDSYDMLDEDSIAYYTSELPKFYTNFFGFVNWLSLFNSLYALMFASIDRFIAIHYHLRYNKDRATYYAKGLAILMWIMWTVYALLPVLVPQAGPYEISAGGNLISVSNEVSFYTCGIAFIVPLIVMWIFTIGVQISIKRQWMADSEVLCGIQKRNFAASKRVSITLSIMIGVFSISILPAIIIIVASDTVPEINPININQFSLKSASAFQSAQLAAAFFLVSNSL